ncbi:MAG: ABC transporter ATP-binding protein/permease [Eubacterium sp.]|nr:ABC transporter ATP-binding protein/permease [Eubacterium sp.]
MRNGDELLFACYIADSLFFQYLDFINIPSTFRAGRQTRYTLSDTDCFEIEFQNNRYPNQEQDSLHNVSVTIRSGEKISIVGENGAGKTTFIKLLLRLYDPTEGAIYLNGTDIRDIDYDDYCRIFATVFQDFNLFALTLRENLTLGNAAVTDEELEEAARKIGFLHFIQSLPKQFDTFLYSDYDKEGVDLSGGEAQKTAILRTLLRKSSVIIMDEPTAALDPQAEYDIYQMIDESVGNQLMIYISHRLASSRFCDRILLFADGGIAEEGTHEHLMAEDTAYKALFQLQAQYYMEEENG